MMKSISLNELVSNNCCPNHTTGQLGDLETILAWNNLDPVDDFEKNEI